MDTISISFWEKMEKNGVPSEVCKLFLEYLDALKREEKQAVISEKEISPAEKIDTIRDFPTDYREVGLSSREKVVLIKLNGGLGTTMGMPYPKSLIQVKEGLSFLDIAIRQSNLLKLPLCLMDSFYTHEQVLSYISKNYPSLKGNIYTFVQHRFPKVLASDFSPATYPEDPSLEWNPPGHGDIYASLFYSGMLEKFLNMGISYAFISNIDNLGAVFEPSILGYMIDNNLPFLMEVTRRLQRDKKGGHIALKGNRIILREVAQCPRGEENYFMDIDTHRYFNTNNIWLDLNFLYEYLKRKGIPRLPIIANPKTLNPRDPTSPRVFQIETAMGSAISVFENARVLEVSRKRYIPVKNTSDLLVVSSDCYDLTEQFVLQPCFSMKEPPRVELDEKYYRKIDDFLLRFPQGVPSLKECFSLKVIGNVIFEEGIRCIQNVEVVNKHPVQAIIPRGKTLRGKVIL